MSSWREEFLEESFILMNHLGMSYTEIRRLPITYRRWFIDRVVTEFQRKADAQKTANNQSSRNNRTRDVEISDQMVRQMREANKPAKPAPPKFSKEKKF